ncbi:hypothetical protein X798_03593 [Onchocerca flexuosa]|uniref:Uncharacterized protein n=1 Tax=Onchocerca flexuosa TaxID=387005 RepID=A0A238BVZ5_9BILA|nr:hypothetical protein X798_03593 [Onchocerca flexuosa]
MIPKNACFECNNGGGITLLSEVEDSKGAYLADSESLRNDRKDWFRIRDPLWKGLVDDNLISARSTKIFSPKVECGEGDDAGDNNEPLYVLSDGSNLSELLHVANDMDLAFTYNSRRTGEFCFESNAQDMRGRLVVFADLGTKVAVRERFNGSDLSYEEWNKADWKQFLWAVRGKCMNVLRGL